MAPVDDSPGIKVERIAVLPASLADQIAAGEVVERPASVVKELIDNAVDAGASRIEVELEGAGMTLVRVVDDGRGMHPDDLPLALRRHATSKIRRAEELVEIRTLGFRGEALASIAAVARATLRSRMRGSPVGSELRSLPGEAPTQTPVGMPEGTQIEVSHLFAAVPARRKFVRAEATEVGHCSDAVVRVALAHPEVHFVLRHEGRRLLDLPRSDARGRMTQILERRGPGPYHVVEGEQEGVRVRAFLAPPTSASRQRKASFVVVRRRVVSERSLRQILHAAYGDQLGAGLHPVAGIEVDPPPGTVDVNVHPQKAEVRFADPQAVYSAAREVLRAGMASAPWRRGGEAGEHGEAAGHQGAARAFEGAEGVAAVAAASWDFGAVDRGGRGGTGGGGGFAGGSGRGGGAGAVAPYRLGTRAASPDYAEAKAELRAQRFAFDRAPSGSAPAGAGAEAEREPPPEAPRLLTCLPGPVAIFEHEASLLAVDLVALRARLVRARLVRELGGEGIESQRLLSPVVVALAPRQVELCVASRPSLLALGVDLEPFGGDAVVVRGVPARLDDCVDPEGLGALLARLVPWLELGGGQDPASAEVAIEAMADLSARRVEAAAVAELGETTVDPSPRRAARFARQWLRELIDEVGMAALDATPGVRRWSAGELRTVRKAGPRGGGSDA